MCSKESYSERNCKIHKETPAAPIAIPHFSWFFRYENSRIPGQHEKGENHSVFLTIISTLSLIGGR